MPLLNIMDGLLLAALGIAVAAFASTNVDGMLVLVSFLTDPRYSMRAVVLGECLGMGVLVGVSVACALLTLAIPSGYVGLLGFAPVAIGLARLRTAWRERSDEVSPLHAGSCSVLSVTGVTIANGGDNLGTYIPLFATSTTTHLVATVAVFAAMTVLWCLLAHLLARHHALGALVRRWSVGLLPLVLIVLGACILWRSGSIGLLAGSMAAS